MTTREIKTAYNGKWMTYNLTTDHAASSHGQPVLVDEHGVAYGPADIVVPGSPDGFFAPTTAADAVLSAYGNWADGLPEDAERDIARAHEGLGTLDKMTAGELALVRKFVRLGVAERTGDGA